MRTSYFLAAAMTAALSLAGCKAREATAANDQANAAETANVAANDANTAAAPSAATANTVGFQGCPIRTDVDAGCLTVKSDNGVTYELYSSQPLPDPSQRLVVVGTGTTGGVSTCMAGTPLNNVKWHYTKMQCQIGKEK